MEYQNYNDYELIDLILKGSEDAHDIMIEKYKPLIKNIATKMLDLSSNIGLELADLEQEGIIGLCNAIDNYDSLKDVSFYTYAKTCIKRKILSSIINSNRLKHRVLNESLSFDNENFNQQVLKDDMNIPENIVMSEDYIQYIMWEVEKKLTDSEKEVFELLKLGFNYKEIAQSLDKDSKVIDNTIQRIKRKLSKIKEEY